MTSWGSSMKVNNDLSTTLYPFRERSRYHRSGLVFVDTISSPVLTDLIRELPADRIDWVRHVVDGLRSDQKWVSQTPESLLTELISLARGPGQYIGRVIFGLEITLSRWKQVEIHRFWTKFLTLEKNASHAVLVVLEESAAFLGPESRDIEAFELGGRLLRFNSEIKDHN